MRSLAVLLVAFGLLSCHQGQGRPSGSRRGWLSVQDCRGLVLVWRRGDGFETGYAPRDVPVWARGRVRVICPGQNLAPGQALVADLCRRRQDGKYPYRVMSLRAFESAPPKGCGGAALPEIVVYVSSTCPVCRKALAYLQQRKIPFVAKDVDADPGAAAELARKAAEAGISVRGVPVFDLGGRLVQGFDPRLIEAFVGGGNK